VSSVMVHAACFFFVMRRPPLGAELNVSEPGVRIDSGKSVLGAARTPKDRKDVLYFVNSRDS
jgi:hypothetical protein